MTQPNTPTADDPEMIRVEGLSKAFTLHNQGGIRIPVLEDVSFTVKRGECVVLAGASGSGKSTLLRSIHANYLAEAGSILVRHDETWIDLVGAPPHLVLDIRERTLGHVSQFLRVIPRIGALDLVAQPLLTRGFDETAAQRRAESGSMRRSSAPEMTRTGTSGGAAQRSSSAGSQSERILGRHAARSGSPHGAAYRSTAPAGILAPSANTRRTSI